MKLNFKSLFNQPVFTDFYVWLKIVSTKYWWVNLLALVIWVIVLILMNIFFIIWIYLRLYTDIYWFELPVSGIEFILIYLKLYKMMYWFKILYKVNYKTVRLFPLYSYNPTENTIWIWRLYYSGFCCDELYYRSVEIIARKVMIIPALFILDKYISKFMNNKILINILHIWHNFIMKKNLTSLSIVKFFIFGTITFIIFSNLIIII